MFVLFKLFKQKQIQFSKDPTGKKICNIHRWNNKNTQNNTFIRHDPTHQGGLIYLCLALEVVSWACWWNSCSFELLMSKCLRRSRFFWSNSNGVEVLKQKYHEICGTPTIYLLMYISYKNYIYIYRVRVFHLTIVYDIWSCNNSIAAIAFGTLRILWQTRQEKS